MSCKTFKKIKICFLCYILDSMGFNMDLLRNKFLLMKGNCTACDLVELQSNKLCYGGAVSLNPPLFNNSR